ncbi:LytTR family transcriptional regulator DNA-binding domain-containing protein [Brevibacillus sp. SYSU BS000544]|uniref:LytTR family transcriptional regulator DNA-binding domain-containing protein n=1 Tax=Brevibacillus sp. SYSU BS000544 TaxID=3416443 RepID=UPI003CE49022
MASIKITGIRFDRQEGLSDYHEFDLDDIFFVTSFKAPNTSNRSLVFHTRFGKFHPISTLEQIREEWGIYGFIALDTVNVVNVKHIKYIEKSIFWIRAYFEDGSFTTVSRPRYHLVKDLPGKTIHSG